MRLNSNIDTNQRRIQSLDFIRGIAVLGILFVNMQSFSMPAIAYLNPSVYSDFKGINVYIWALEYIFIDSKFRSIFSILFGAGIYLFCESLNNKGIDPKIAHLRRMFWLAIFGILHSYILWHGDILFSYAVCGVIVFFFKDYDHKRLWRYGLIFLAIALLSSLLQELSILNLNTEQLANINNYWSANDNQISADISAFQGTWRQGFQLRSQLSKAMNSTTLILNSIWQYSGLMLIGMALAKMNYFTSNNKTKIKTLRLFLIGTILSSCIISLNLITHWSLYFSMVLAPQLNMISGVCLSLAYLQLISSFISMPHFKRFKRLIENTGQLSLTSYLMQSVICTSLFYGYGLGLFGQLNRLDQLCLALFIIVIQILMNNLWSLYFKRGPLESLWRKLTYIK